MSCCGQGRAALRPSRAIQTPKAPRIAGNGIARVAADAALRANLPIRYLGAAPIVVRGLVTGRAYQFAAGRAIQPVDARDVAGLLKKGIFRRST